MSVDDSYTKSLLHFNGADASTTFIDESGKVWTAHNHAQLDTAQKKFGTASGLFDGVDDYIDTPDSADWYLADGDNTKSWTIDFWLRFNGNPTGTGQGLVQQWGGSDTEYWEITWGFGYLYLSVWHSGANVFEMSRAWAPVGSTWYHIAIIKDGTNGYKMFVDGTQLGTTFLNTGAIPDFNGPLQIGKITIFGPTTYWLSGWIDEFRLSKGIARWTSNFTPPSTEYKSTAVQGVHLMQGIQSIQF